MADMTRIPILRHLRSETSSHVLHYRRGRVVRSGRGLAFWFMPMAASISEVPIDDREIPFFFHGRSADFQDVTTQGVITFRVVDPQTLAQRVDFSIDLDEGTYRKEPLEQLAQMVTQLAQQIAMAYVGEHALRAVLADGPVVLRDRLRGGLSGEEGFHDAGIEIVSVRIAAVKPTSELERALQTPTLEGIQQSADKATFARRAQAVEEERAIRENELQSEIELAKRQEQLIEQEGQNRKRQAEEGAAAQLIDAEAKATRGGIAAVARAEGIRLVEGAQVEAEKARVDIYRDLPTHVVVGLAAREFAAKLQSIDHLNITPDLLGPLMGDLAAAATKRLGS